MIDGPPKPVSPLSPVSNGFLRLSLFLYSMLQYKSEAVLPLSHIVSLHLSLSLAVTAACGLASVNPLILGRCPGQIRPHRDRRTRPACQPTPASASSSTSQLSFSSASAVHLLFLLLSPSCALLISVGSAPSPASLSADLCAAEMTGLDA